MQDSQIPAVENAAAPSSVKTRFDGSKAIALIGDICFAFWLFTEAVLAHTTISQIALVLVMLASFALVLTKKKACFSYWMILSALLIIWNTLGIYFWSIDAAVTKDAVQTFVVNFVFFAAVFQYLVLRGNFERVLTMYLLAFCAIIAYLVIMIGPANILVTRLGWFIGINSNKIGILTTFALAISLYKVFNARYWALIPLFLSLAGEVLALSFTALAGAAVIVVVFILIAWPKYWPLKILAMLVLGVGASIILVKFWPLATVKYNDTIAALTTPPQPFGSSIVHRRWLIQFGFQHFLERPVTGFGSNCFHLLEGAARGNEGTYAHNNYIELLVDGGAVQFVLYYAISVIALIRAFRGKHEKKLTARKALAVLYIAMLVIEFGTVVCFERERLIIPILLIASTFPDPSETGGKWLKTDFHLRRKKQPQSQEAIEA
ncbi:MAG: O-antigen ligase family protein [Clostridiaceae bacterium]